MKDLWPPTDFWSPLDYELRDQIAAKIFVNKVCKLPYETTVEKMAKKALEMADAFMAYRDKTDV